MNIHFTNVQKFFALTLLCAITLTGLPIFTEKVSAAGTITGRVFQDFNGNGTYDTAGSAALPAIDTGIAGVTVTAYDSAGVSRGTATTIAAGTYSLAATGTGPYRVEFTNLPAGYKLSARSTDSVLGGTTTNSGSTVQFVNDGATADLNLAINVPDDYCQNNPLLCSAVQRPGNQSGTRSTTFAVPYNTPTINTNIATEGQTGSVWGTAYQASTKTVFQSAVMKRHAGFGSLGTGGIYKVNAATGVVGTYVNVQSIGLNTGTDPRVTAGYTLPATGSTPHWDHAAYTEVGKRSIGDIDYDAASNTLWFINLADRRLHGIKNVNPNTTPVNADLVRDSSSALGFAVNTSPAITCTNGVLRPWGIEIYKGNVYVGAVCTGENAGATAANLIAYVLKLDPNNPAAGFSQVVSQALNYTRTAIGFGGDAPWQPWRSSDSTRTIIANTIAQPIVSDIEFDKDGSIIMGLRDRWGDQYAANQYLPDPTQTNTTTFTPEIFAFGDILRFCYNGTVFSNPGTAGCANNPRPAGETRSPNQGPGNGEFYSGDWGPDSPNSFSDITHGALALLPGSNRVVSTVHDPGSYFSGGFIWLSNTDGSRLGNYDVFQGSSLNTTNDFNKGNGLGDVELLCDVAPIEVGNRVWRDANNNGVQDAGENSIQNVDVELWADTNADSAVDTRVGTVPTDVNGEYYFGGAANTNMLSNPAACPAIQTTTLQVNASGNDAWQTSAGVVNINGTVAQMAGGTTAGTRFTGVAIPQGATITNAYVQFTADNSVTNNAGSPTVTVFGENSNNAAAFTTAASNVSGRPDTTTSASWAIPAWGDANASTIAQQTPNLKSIVQEIVNRAGWLSGNAMVFTISGGAAGTRRDWETFDGAAGNAPRLIVSYSAPQACTYTVNPNTAYQVRVPSSEFGAGQPLVGLFSATPNNDVTANGDSRDSDGSGIAGGHVAANFNTGSAGDNSHTYDFGFSPTATYSIGNRVWYDTNSNGRVDAAEVGINNISVSVFNDTGCDGTADGAALQTLNTDANGYYRFDGLAAGCFVVRVNPSNFTGTLNGYKNTTGNTTTDTDSDVTNAGENGINPVGALNSVNTNGILSNTITLGPGSTEPTSETDVAGSGIYAGQGSADNQADMTVDFGFYSICLCGTIWQDNGAGGGVNNNGIQDGGELGIPSLRVRVYDSAGTEIPVGDDGILGTGDDAVGGALTDATGNYRFRGLLAGDYRIAVAPANSSTPTSNTPNNNTDLDDNGFITGAAIGSIPTGWVVSYPITLTAGGEPLVNNADGSTANVTLDMGIIAAPSAVQMNEFNIYVEANKAVVAWATGTELNNLGFNVYREVGGNRTLLNKTPIVGSAFRSAELKASGESYQWTDNEYSKEANYLVEDIDLNGNSTFHSGPAASETSLAKFGVENSKSLADISEASNDARFETEAVTAKLSKALKTNNKVKFNAAAAQAKQLEIAQLGGLKVEVNRSGWHRISAWQLLVGNLSGDATNWQLFANGEEVAMKVNGDNSVEFYGQNTESRETESQAYYLVNGKNAGLRLETVADPAAQNAPQVVAFQSVAERKERTVYAAYLLNGDKENWFGPSVYTNNATVQTLNAVNLADGKTKLSVKLQGYTTTQHAVRVSLNDTELGTVEFNNLESKTAEFNLPANVVREGANQVKLTALNASDVSLIESVKLTYSKQYKAVSNQLRFTIAANTQVSVKDFDTEPNVFEVENGRAVRQIKVEMFTENDKFGFGLSSDNRDREFVAMTEDQANQVAKFEQNTPSNLASNNNGTSFVIIAPRSLAAKAERLANVRRSQRIRTQVVEVEDIYDEFSYGLHDGQAIKNFLQFATSNWNGKPQYVLLFGDSSADSKGYLNGTSRDLVPTKLVDTNYMETASDSSLADFNGDDIEDIAIGRLPVATDAEADAMLAKLARYDAQTPRQTLKNVMVADGEFGSLSDGIANRMPAGMTTVKLNRAEIGDANMRSQIVANVNDNPIVVSYFGHGNTSNWTNAGVFNKTDATGLSNQKLSFYLLMTCLNGYTHSPYADSLAESLMRSNGGAIAVLASPNLNLPDGQQELRSSIYNLMFNVSGSGARALRFGGIIKAAKANTNDRDVRKSYLLIGDPTVLVK